MMQLTIRADSRNRHARGGGCNVASTLSGMMLWANPESTPRKCPLPESALAPTHHHG